MGNISWLNKETKKAKTDNIWSLWTATTMLCVCAFVPLFSIGDVAEYSGLFKYYNIERQVCLGGNNLRNYQILPTIYNTTLTYFPARLQVTTQYWQNKSDSVGLVSAELIYPTTYMKILDCDCNNKGCERMACDKMVGDVIIKYQELQALDEFPCYVHNGHVVGLDDEQASIDSNYIMVTAGIIILVFWFISTVMYFYACIRIYDAGVNARNNANLELKEKQPTVQRKIDPYHKAQTVTRDGVTYQTLEANIPDNSSEL